jgi:hypothetical protein
MGLVAIQRERGERLTAKNIFFEKYYSFLCRIKIYS